MLRNQRVHEYLTYGMPLTVDRPEGRRTRTIRFFDFDHPEGGLNEFVVTTQFRVRRGRRDVAARRTMSVWSYPTWFCSSTASPWW